MRAKYVFFSNLNYIFENYMYVVVIRVLVVQLMFHSWLFSMRMHVTSTYVLNLVHTVPLFSPGVVSLWCGPRGKHRIESIHSVEPAFTGRLPRWFQLFFNNRGSTGRIGLRNNAGFSGASP